MHDSSGGLCYEPFGLEPFPQCKKEVGRQVAGARTIAGNEICHALLQLLRRQVIRCQSNVHLSPQIVFSLHCNARLAAASSSSATSRQTKVSSWDRFRLFRLTSRPFSLHRAYSIVQVYAQVKPCGILSASGSLPRPRAKASGRQRGDCGRRSSPLLPNAHLLGRCRLC